MKKLLLALLILATPSVAAARDYEWHVFTNGASTTAENMIEGVALNAAAATRTLTLPLGRRWSKLLVFVFFTRSAATDVQATVECAGVGTSYGKRQSRSISSGTATNSDFTDSNAVTGDEDFYWEYDVRGCQNFKMVFSGTSGGASDLIDVQAVAVKGE